MWDNIGGEHGAKRAEANYQQLQNDIWKSFIEEGAHITQFHNTQKSALSILDEAFAPDTRAYFSIEEHLGSIKGSPFEANLLTDLQDRIQNLQSNISTLHDELAHAEAQNDVLLQSIVRPKLQEAKMDLTRFQQELDDSGLLRPVPRPSVSPGFDPLPLSLWISPR
ncbi:hypothetical protein BJ165DRAFT_1532639 [Panaeolus papilionaceus]|nr:hypothetical protein BJ165DRAFT_1532639 [Panaeolus papilionaceus]